MLEYFLKRLFISIPVVLGVILFVSLLVRMIPGDPVEQILGPYASDQDKQSYRKQLGLDLNSMQQVQNYFSGLLLRGDLGVSLIKQRNVFDLIKERIGATFSLALTALSFAWVLSLVLGLTAARFQNTWIDYIASFFSIIGISMPNFWLGPLLVMFFGLYLGWLPVSERQGPLSYILPALTMGLALTGILTRMTRTAMLENLKEDYVRTARAKGLHDFLIFIKHVLRNAYLPVVTILGLQFGVLLTGSIITERIFDWPGLGTLMMNAIETRDYPLIQGCVLTFSLVYIFVNFLTDMVYRLLDPRIKL